MGTRRLPLTFALALLPAACGGDDDGGDENLCPEMAAPTATIDSYPGEVSGQTVGAGANLTAAEGTCSDEGGGWLEPVGEDVVIALENLTPGQVYGIDLQADEDLGYYVVTGCQIANAGPTTGECLVFNDVNTTGESGVFTAPEGGEVWVVIDSVHYMGVVPTTGAFTMRVVEAQCTPEDNTCPAPTPACVGFQCVECGTSFDCASADEPVCAIGNTCEAGFGECTGDDEGDGGAGGDDGPAAATTIDEPTEGNETVVEAAVCSKPVSSNGITVEEDYYTFDVTTAGAFGFELKWESDSDLDLVLFDGAGAILYVSQEEGNVPEQFGGELPEGTYYLSAYLYDPADSAEAVPYTLTVRAAECETDFDCIEAAGEPVCDFALACSAGPAECTDDDAGDGGGGDDGPGGGRSLTGAVGVETTLTGSICNVPDAELDYYQIDTTAVGQGLVVELSWAAAAADMDLAILDDQGRVLGTTFWTNPEVITLTRLPVGTYYAQVLLYEPEGATGAVDYTISSTRTAADTCTTVADCADEYTTQFFRGVCDGGACTFYEPDEPVAIGEFCDSHADCEVACSYMTFESDAEKSVCIDACTTDADCEAQGDGLVCTTGGDVNSCTAACTSDLECGVDATSADLDDGEPWDYRSCNVDTGSCGL